MPNLGEIISSFTLGVYTGYAGANNTRLGKLLRDSNRPIINQALEGAKDIFSMSVLSNLGYYLLERAGHSLPTIGDHSSNYLVNLCATTVGNLVARTGYAVKHHFTDKRDAPILEQMEEDPKNAIGHIPEGKRTRILSALKDLEEVVLSDPVDEKKKVRIIKRMSREYLKGMPSYIAHIRNWIDERTKEIAEMASMKSALISFYESATIGDLTFLGDEPNQQLTIVANQGGNELVMYGVDYRNRITLEEKDGSKIFTLNAPDIVEQDRFRIPQDYKKATKRFQRDFHSPNHTIALVRFPSELTEEQRAHVIHSSYIIYLRSQING